MKQVVLLKQEILRMSAGDLSTPLVSSGADEIGVLSRELDHLRLTLDQNIRQEQEAHQSNRELIAALSHDLRTPLTVLHGYLDILQLDRNPDMQNTYVTRCLQKPMIFAGSPTGCLNMRWYTTCPSRNRSG